MLRKGAFVQALFMREKRLGCRAAQVRRLAMAAVALAVALFGAEAAQAQGSHTLFRSSSLGPVPNFFSLLFGGFQSRRSYEPYRPQIEFGPRGTESYGPGVAVGYCVRTCDGRYFPLQGRPSGAADPEALAQCRAFCPAAPVAVYTSADKARGIELAVGKDGKPYSALPSAYVYRERLVEGCTCTGRVGGLATLDVTRDPTLKRGDIVMTPEGGRVFAGAKAGPPFRQADFVAPAAFPELSSEMRARLRELQVASR